MGGQRQMLVLLMSLCCLTAACTKEPIAFPKATTTAKKLTQAQELATKDYVALLDRQIDSIEHTADILATVTSSRDTWQIALARLEPQSNEMDKIASRLQAERPADPAVLEECKSRVEPRLQKVHGRLQAEVQRIVSPEVGGLDFFEKELRPVLKRAQGVR